MKSSQNVSYMYLIPLYIIMFFAMPTWILFGKSKTNIWYNKYGYIYDSFVSFGKLNERFEYLRTQNYKYSLPKSISYHRIFPH